MKTQAVIFDMDGVIVDTEKIWDRVFDEFFALHNGTFNETLRTKIMGSGQAVWSTAVKTELQLQDEWPTERIAQWCLDRVHEEMKKRIDIMPGFKQVIALIKKMNLRLALASGATQDTINMVLQHTDLESLFEVAISSNQVRKPKPAPDVYVEAAMRIQVHPNACVGIEDSPNGVQSVLAAGMKCIAVPNEFLLGNPIFETAHVVRSSLKDVTAEDLTIS